MWHQLPDHIESIARLILYCGLIFTRARSTVLRSIWSTFWRCIEIKRQSIRNRVSISRTFIARSCVKHFLLGNAVKLEQVPSLRVPIRVYRYLPVRLQLVHYTSVSILHMSMCVHVMYTGRVVQQRKIDMLDGIRWRLLLRLKVRGGGRYLVQSKTCVSMWPFAINNEINVWQEIIHIQPTLACSWTT